MLYMFVEKPSFAKRMENRASMEGSTTVLECLSAGNPKPKLEWLKDGHEIDVTERHYFTADNQLLVIVQTAASDAGVYTCLMTNTVGSERGYMRLAVISQDSLPNVTAQWSASSGDSLTLGVIIIAVVCCVVGTSVVWVVIIYHTRKKATAYRMPPRLLATRLDYCDQDPHDNDSAFFEQQELQDGSPITLHSASEYYYVFEK